MNWKDLAVAAKWHLMYLALGFLTTLFISLFFGIAFGTVYLVGWIIFSQESVKITEIIAATFIALYLIGRYFKKSLGD